MVEEGKTDVLIGNKMRGKLRGQGGIDEIY
jgi:hypothetical protein